MRRSADGGYRESKHFTSSEISPHFRETHGLIRARHETANRRLKQFGALGQRFRHGIQKHSAVFHSIANLTQLQIEDGSPLFAVEIWRLLRII